MSSLEPTSTQDFHTANRLTGGVAVADARLQKGDDGHYQVTFIDYQLEFLADRLRWSRDELFGQLAVACGLPGARTFDDGVVSVGTFNFSSMRARHDLARQLENRIRAPKRIDFVGVLEEVCQRIVIDVRRGEPAIILRDVPRPPRETEFDIDGLKFPKHHGTIIFGDGGSLKSWLGLYVGAMLTARGCRVGLFDWELDAETHRLRLEQLCGADMPSMRYVKCETPLVHEVDRLRRIVRDERLEFAIYDSVGYACAGPPEAAEHAMAYWRAVRHIGVGAHHIAHVRQGDGNDQRPFGSGFWHNSARSTWFVHLVPPTDGQPTRIGLHNRKNNLGPAHLSIAFEVTFGPECTRFDPINIADVEELAADAPLWQRMRDAVRRGPLTLAQLADQLDAKVDTLDRTIRRKTQLFTRVAGIDGISRIALVETRQVAP